MSTWKNSRHESPAARRFLCTDNDPSILHRELERKRSVFPPVSFRLPDRKRSEKNTNSPRFLQAVSRFADARKKFVTKAGRVRT
ncbi:hypothetical protein ALC53_00727 [Atta colombica]|uniref:Uncharacterized protein n=1 Tax=Atta colombica TaxID=520822 RepID=A0A195BWX5_9HYME|nr:hypothetical protein ALC53_00727 [Atta colombica]